MAATAVSVRTYILVWIALMFLCALTAGLSFLNLHHWSTVIAFSIAVAKAALVVVFFMGLLYETDKIVWVWAGVAMFWLGILIIMTVLDYATRGYLRVPGK